MLGQVDFNQHFLPNGTEAGVNVAVDPPRRTYQVDSSFRNAQLMQRRHAAHHEKEQESRHIEWERTHTTFRPPPQFGAWLMHPHATVAGVASDVPTKDPWIYRLLRSPFVQSSGTASVVSAREHERARRLR